MKVTLALTLTALLASPIVAHDVRDPCDGVVVGDCAVMLELERRVPLPLDWDPSAVEAAFAAAGFVDILTSYAGVEAASGDHLRVSAVPAAGMTLVEATYTQRVAEGDTPDGVAARSDAVLALVLDIVVTDLMPGAEATPQVAAKSSSYKQDDGRRWFAWQREESSA